MFGPKRPDRTTWWGGGDYPVVLDEENRSEASGIFTDLDVSREQFDFHSSKSYQTTPLSNPRQSAERWESVSPRPDTNQEPDLEQQVFFVPERGSETPITLAKRSGFQLGSTTPDVQRNLSHAPTEDVREVALRMFRVLKDHGLIGEAQEAILPQGKGTTGDSVDGPPHKSGSYETGGYGQSDASNELLGMDYILKDGIVSYLRDVAKLTPALPQQVVRFLDINYSTMTQAPASGFETFGAKLFNCFFGILVHPFREKEKPTHLDILKDVTGYIMPGSMTLLLGPPGSGKSSLLKVLAGRAETNKVTHLDGTVLFNDRLASEILLTRLIAYVNGQLNKHLPFLTVRETLEFAEECTQGLRPVNFTPHMRKFFAQALVQGQDPYLEYILYVLGLKGIEHQLVGAGQDGITENDRNRLTTAEIAMGTYSVMLYDQPCHGQDSLATYDLVSTLRAIGRFQQCSAVMSLVQVAPEVFDLFDRIILLGEGQVLYQGPRQDVLSYFGRLGYEKPVHLDAADFLMEIAAGEGSQYMSAGNANLSLADLSTTYKLSDMHKDVLRIVHSEDVLHTFWVESEPNLRLSVKRTKSSSSASRADVEVVVSKFINKVENKMHGIESTGTLEVGDIVTGISLPSGEMYYLNVGSKKDEQNKVSSLASLLSNARGHVRLQLERLRDPEVLEEEEMNAKQFSREYIQTWSESTISLIKRQIKVSRRLTVFILLRFIQVLVLGLFSGSLFFGVGGRYDLLRMNSVRGIGFVTTMNVVSLSLVQLPLFMMQRPIFYKQREQRFFRVSSYIITHSVVGIPQSLIEAFIYSTGVYFMAGLDRRNQGGAFFQYIAIMFTVSWFSTSLVLALSGLAGQLEKANSLLGLLYTVILLFSGFVIYPSIMPSYWRWVVNVNPIRWANVAFALTQFRHLYENQCTAYVDTLYFCAKYPNMTAGLAFLNFYELHTQRDWFWLSLAIVVGWIIFVQILALIVYHRIRHTSVAPSLPSQNDKVGRSIPCSFVTDAKHETASGISWTGYVLQGDDDLQQLEVQRTPKHNLQKLGYRGTEYDLELADHSAFHVHERTLDWRYASLPVKPATLSFHNLSFMLKDPRTHEVKLLLDKVSGYAKPGNMLALVGGNKSGKTTLLKCLANRGLEKGSLRGDILVNGFTLNAATFSRVAGFAERLDAHQPFLTVRESLMFSAVLRLGNEVQGEDRVFHVDLILDLLELTVNANQLVGSLRDATGRTFEVAKKITIAVELAANPSILFLDEPTSGLDGLGARNIIHAIQIIAATGRTIVTTIQHPSARMLSAFKSVIILSSGGEQVYFGPVGANCTQLLEYFGAIPKVPKYDMKQNPVTFVFNLLGCGTNIRDPMYEFSEVYTSSSLASLNSQELQRLRRQNKRSALKPVLSGYAASFQTQAIMVFLRTQRFLWRNVAYTFGRIVSIFAVGLLMGSVYFQIHQDSILSLGSSSLFIYVQVILLGVVTATNVVPQLGTDRLAYFRERRAAMYSPIFYPVSWAIAEIPYLLLGSLFFVAIGNGLAGLATDSVENFVKYWLALFLFILAMAYYGMLVTIATPEPILASFVLSLSTSIWVTTSGVIISRPVFRTDWVWLFWANPFQYIMNSLNSVAFHCDLSRPQCLTCVPLQACPACGCAQLTDLEYTFSWVALVRNRAINNNRVPYDFAALAGLGIFFALLAVLSFVFLKHNRS